MTQPEDQQEELEESADSLLPALATVLAAYATYGATKSAVTGPWRQIAETLGISAAIGEGLYQVADRALASQRRQVSPRRAEALLEQVDPARKAGYEAGLKLLTRAAKPIIRQVNANPNPDEPPDYLDPQKLHKMVAHAVISTAQLTAAAGSGMKRKRWNNVKDLKSRHSHAVLGSKTYPGSTVPIGHPFVTPDGTKIDRPGDPNAPLDELINCRCWLTFHP